MCSSYSNIVHQTSNSRASQARGACQPSPRARRPTNSRLRSGSRESAKRCPRRSYPTTVLLL